MYTPLLLGFVAYGSYRLSNSLHSDNNNLNYILTNALCLKNKMIRSMIDNSIYIVEGGNSILQILKNKNFIKVCNKENEID